jgi:hypothetical protein
LLLLLTSVVLSGLLDSKTSLGAGKVGVAVVVHGLLQGVALPAEDVVTVGGRTTRSTKSAKIPAKHQGRSWGGRNVPDVHGVDERIGAISRPQALVGKLAHVPHELVHNLRQLNRVCRRASTASVRAGTLAVGNVALVVRRVKVLAVPAGGEDDGLADELALGVLGDGNSVGATAGSATNEGALAG